MSAQDVSGTLATSARQRTGPRAEPRVARLLSAAVLLTTIAILAARGAQLAAQLEAFWADWLQWVLLMIMVNLIPVTVDDLQLTLDLPLHLAVAILYGPELAAAAALVGTVDVREFGRPRISVSRSLFNRGQVGLSIFLAGVVFHTLSPPTLPLLPGLLALIAALATEHVVNTVVVALHVAPTRGLTLGAAFRRLTSERPAPFLATYLGYGVLAVILVRLRLEDGMWLVYVFMIPLLVARQALMRTQQLERATYELNRQKAILSRVLDRVVTERKDERRLIAGELHDDVLQHLMRTQLAALALAERELGGSGREGLQGVVDASAAAMRALRRVIRGLKDSALGPGGLVPALEQLVLILENEWGRRIESDLPSATPLAPEAQLVAYQCAREGLVNALKHSGASHIRVRLREAESEAVLMVLDDGSGFDPDRAVDEDHFGLDLLEEQVRGVGGRLEILSNRRNGTRLEIHLPLEPRSS